LKQLPATVPELLGLPHMRFANPEAFGLLILLPLALWQFVRTRRGRGAARFSSLGMVARLPGGWAVVGTALLLGLRVTALVLLIAALARPQTVDHHVRTHSDGIAIQLVIDNSASMQLRDYDLDGQSISRLDAVKHAVRLFVSGGANGLEGRPNDKIGIITFARDPDVACPATLDHGAVLEALDRIQLAPPVGTNIGDGLAWALDRIYRDPTRQKVVILLSDGSHNARDAIVPPLQAAALAKDLKIKVYTIGAVGNQFGKSELANMVRRAQDPLYAMLGGDNVDEPLMQKIAAETGGQYYRATDTEGLAHIYQEIDRLETTQLEHTGRLAHREWFLVLVIPAVLLVVAEQLLAATRLLRIP
jgi:Ca-activated chloride channel homolog